MAKKQYKIEREGQIDFFKNYNIPYIDDNSILVDNTDGVYNGNILEFKLNITNLNKVLLQAIKYLSRMRIKGEDVPATILLIDLNNEKIYQYKSSNYKKYIHKVYTGAASKNNSGFIAGKPDIIYNYSKDNPNYMADSAAIKKQLKGDKKISEKIMPIDIDENCIVGWAERYYRELPKASKGDFLGDDTGVAISVQGEIRNPRHFKGHINPYSGTSNEKFKYLMDCLNDKLSKKDLGAFYTPMLYAEKSIELVKIAVQRALDMGKKDYIILDRCAGTGNLESGLIDVKDANGDVLIGHCIVSTYEYYEYKVLNERIGDKVRDIIPPTEADVVYENGKVSNADAMSEDFINNPIIKQYIDDENCAIILFENPPYDDTSSIRQAYEKDGNKHKTNNKQTYVFSEMKKVKNTFKNTNISTVRDFANRFIWSGFEYYLRQAGDSYILFSPVKYFKSLGIFEKPEKRFLNGFLFNKKHFHATASSIGCILWTYEFSNTAIPFKLDIIDIVDNKLTTLGEMEIKQVNTTLSSSNSKYIGTIETNIACNSKGEQVIDKKIETTIYVDSEVIGYFCPVSASFNLGRLPYFNGRGNYILKSNFLEISALFAAKMYPFNKWYEKDSIFITYDGGNKYIKDKDFLKSCFIYTCLSVQNNCLTFDGFDNRHYQNELCFDNNTVASKKLATMELDKEEKQLINLWKTILNEAKMTGKCKLGWTYGVYQITKEINTFEVTGTGKMKKKKYDYPQLNGDLDTLRTMLKDYYKTHIVDKLFKYELIK